MNFLKSYILHPLHEGLALLVLLCFSGALAAQEPDKRETLEYINAQLGGRVEVLHKGGTLFVMYYDSSRVLYREDRVKTPDLSFDILWEPESGLLCVPCLKEYPDCVSREMHVQKIKRGYSRLSIPVANREQFASLRKAMDHLIRMTSENGYKARISFD